MAYGSGKVWEWQRGDGGYSPFPPDDSAKIEADFSAKSATCILSSGDRLDFKRSMMVPAGSRRECRIRQTAITLPQSPAITSYWTWNERGNIFVLYTMEAIVDIELAYQQFVRGTQSARQVNLSVCSSGLPYTLDFSEMKQTRHGYGTKRAIRRVPITGGHSLQSLLQYPPPITGAHSFSSDSSLLTSSAGVMKSPGKSVKGTFSLTCGPATSVAKASTGSRSSASSSGSYLTVGSGSTATTSNYTSSVSHSKPSARKGRGRKSASSAPLEKDISVGGVPKYATPERTLKPTDDGPCPICMCELSEQSGYDEGCSAVPPVPYAPPVDLCKLRKCGHLMHRACLLKLLESDSAKNGLTCPTCKKVYGIKTGDMPDGTMHVRHTRQSLPGHEGNGTIEIVYNFSPGVHKGRRYRTNGFPRTCYLPDTPKGQKVLKLLKIAWERRLTFTIGTSVTTGATDTVVWNEIHHKTESSSNYSGHGYPDPNYLDNVLMELSLQGVEDSDTASSSSSSDDSL